MPPAFPAEIFERIFLHITSTFDLHSLLFVSRLVGWEAKRCLYRNITATGAKMFNMSSMFRDPTICSLVRRLEITHMPWDTDTYHALLTTLSLLPNLRHLIFKGSLTFHDPDWNSLSCLLRDVTNSLETLNFESIDPDSIPLLEKQTHLEELIMENGKATWNPAAFPHLRILGCPGESAMHCLSHAGSPIARMKWTTGVPDATWPPFTSIKSIDISLFTVNVAVFSRIVEKFPGLVYLKCTITPSGFLLALGDEDRERLSLLKLPSLHKVYIHSLSVRRSNDTLDHRNLFRAIRSLQIVELHVGTSATSQRWFRSEDMWKIVPSKPDEWKDYDLSATAHLGLERPLEQLALHSSR